MLWMKFRVPFQHHESQFKVKKSSFYPFSYGWKQLPAPFFQWKCSMTRKHIAFLPAEIGLLSELQ